MKTRALVYCKARSKAEGSEEAGPRIVFAVPETGALEVDLGERSLVQVAKALHATRHQSFDWAAGDAGAKCTLIEWKSGAESDLPAQVAWPEVAAWNVRWLAFPLAVRALRDGNDRRYLQLAVQYISSGGVDENVIAADTGGGLLAQLGAALETEAKVRPPKE